MELLLIRHARPHRAEGGNGPADPGLSELGRRQAQALASWLAGEPLDAIYSSPLRRARETAAPLADLLGLPVAVEPAIAEYDAEATAYIPVEELRAAGDPRWMELPDDVAEFQRTVVEGVEALVANHTAGTIAVICHGGVVNVYLSWVLGATRELFFLPHYTSISRVLAATGGQRSIDSVNETGHLRVADVPLVEL
ncbi:MAG: histidine phosphatase family protein [Acidimicrobiales bacterium]